VAVLIALSAAFCWGASAILVRTGLRYISSTATGTLISLVVGMVFSWTLVLILQPGEVLDVSLETVLLFALVGILNFPMGRFFNYMSMSRLGVARSTPILASSPFFAMMIAVVFTGESIGPVTIIGAALILSGLYVTITAPRPSGS
jgi:drug/metabolite transporter (DMT)-like permease